MFSKHLSALRLAPGESGSISNNIQEVVRLTEVSGRFLYDFQTDLYFADVLKE